MRPAIRYALAVDPGKHQAGASLWLNERLTAVYYTPYQKLTHMVAAYVVTWATQRLQGHVPKLIFEYPQVYRESKQQSKDPNDLLPLTYMLGGVAYAFPNSEIIELRPREWKAQIPKKEDDTYQVAQRLKLGVLEPDELAACMPYIAAMPVTKRHNVWDAIGIGAHGHGRGILHARVRVIPT